MPKGRGSKRLRGRRNKNWRKKAGRVPLGKLARFLISKAKRGLGSRAITTIEMKKG